MHDLEALLFDFPWDDKQSRIKKSVVCIPYEGGGLKIFDVSSFMAAVKISFFYAELIVLTLILVIL